jgi:hypothetical protein
MRRPTISVETRSRAGDESGSVASVNWASAEAWEG